MNAITALARAEAFEASRARPIATVRHLHVSERPLIFIPLMLAGEACAPLAAMTGDSPDEPRLLVVPQPRDRAQRFAFAAGLADVIVPYIQSRFATAETVTARRGGQTRTRYADAPQVWLPTRAGIAFTRLLGRSTRFRRTEGDHAVPPAVPLLGKWLTFLAERAEYPGSCLMEAATDALALHWATGQSAVEDQNLAALIGWIEPPAGQSGRQAALAAEDRLRWPPAGPATDPIWDNEVLTHLIAAWDRARASGGEADRRRARTRLEREISAQLTPTWELMWQAIGLLRSLPPGGHVPARWDADKDAFTWYAEYLSEDGAPQPRRDGAVTAARRLARLERLQASYAIQRAFDDPLVMAAHRLSGEAFAGQVTAAESDRIDGSGPRRRLRPRIAVTTDDLAVVEEGAVLTSPARPKQVGRVISVSAIADGQTEVVLELAGGMGRGLAAEPGSVPALGETVCYAAFNDRFQPPPAFPEPEATPWTHGGPPARYTPTDEDATEAWS